MDPAKETGFTIANVKEERLIPLQVPEAAAAALRPSTG